MDSAFQLLDYLCDKLDVLVFVPSHRRLPGQLRILQVRQRL